MLVSELPATVGAKMALAPSRVAEVVKAKIDNALVRYDAWFLVFVAVILALGATLLIGMGIWCVVYQGKRFTGSWSFRNWGIQVSLECV